MDITRRRVSLRPRRGLRCTHGDIPALVRSDFFSGSVEVFIAQNETDDGCSNLRTFSTTNQWCDGERGPFVADLPGGESVVDDPGIALVQQILDLAGALRLDGRVDLGLHAPFE